MIYLMKFDNGNNDGIDDDNDDGNDGEKLYRKRVITDDNFVHV